MRSPRRDRRSSCSRRAALAALGAAVALLAPGCEPQREQAAPPAPEVLVAEAQQQDVPTYSEWIGTTDGFINAQIRARVRGYLQSQEYRNGSFVEAEAVLFTIDPRPYQAALEDARGQLGRAEAALEKTRQDVARYTPLAAEGAISQQELDNAIQADRANAAAVQSARAHVEQATLDLGWTKITAPISGIAGIAAAQIGDLIEAQTLLTTISQVDPIKVSFPISEQEYLRWADVIAAAMRQPEAAPDRGDLQLILADGSVFPHRGGFALPTREVDITTGTITVQGIFPNPNNILRPGQFAKVRARTGEGRGVVVVPQRAVQEVQSIQQVAVVGADDRVEMRNVVVGERSGSDWIIESGLAAGERIVVEGIQKVRTGMTVKPMPFVQTPATASAAPAA